jgi:hypothetical protein
MHISKTATGFLSLWAALIIVGPALAVENKPGAASEIQNKKKTDVSDEIEKKKTDPSEYLQKLLEIAGLNKDDVTFLVSLAGGTKAFMVMIDRGTDKVSHRLDDVRSYKHVGFNKTQLASLKRGDIVVFSSHDLEELSKIEWHIRARVEPFYVKYTDSAGKVRFLESQMTLKNKSAGATMQVETVSQTLIKEQSTEVDPENETVG